MTEIGASLGLSDGAVKFHLNKARRHRQLASGLSALVALVLVGVGVTAVMRSLPADPETEIGTVTSPPEEVRTTTGFTSSTSPETTTTVPEADTPSTPSLATTLASPSIPPTPATVPPPVSTPDTSTTSTPSPSIKTYEYPSDCGSIMVNINRSPINLISVHENPGFTPEVKNDGPESVEVSFTGPDSDCEVRAEPEDHEPDDSNDGQNLKLIANRPNLCRDPCRVGLQGGKPMSESIPAPVKKIMLLVGVVGAAVGLNLSVMTLGGSAQAEQGAVTVPPQQTTLPQTLTVVVDVSIPARSTQDTVQTAPPVAQASVAAPVKVRTAPTTAPPRIAAPIRVVEDDRSADARTTNTRRTDMDDVDLTAQERLAALAAKRSPRKPSAEPQDEPANGAPQSRTHRPRPPQRQAPQRQANRS